MSNLQPIISSRSARVRDRIVQELYGSLLKEQHEGFAAKTTVHSLFYPTLPGSSRLQIDWESVRSGLVATAMLASTPVRGRKNLYALKNWITAALVHEDKDLIPDFALEEDEEDEVCI